jgi:uncharacterized protein DUF6851/vanadium-dependent haloperoxidase-like protein
MDPPRSLRRSVIRTLEASRILVMVCAVGLFPVMATEQEVTPNVVIQWNNAALQGVRDSKIGPPMVARALAIVHTCIYDAWAAYDRHALGTQLGGSLRQPPSQRRIANKNKAISFAAYRAAVDLFPVDKATVFDPLMTQLEYDPNDVSTDTTRSSGIGNVACAAVLNFRHNDGSNQLGNLTASGAPYADYTGYVPVNPPSTVPVNPATVVDVNHWQPLSYFDATGTFVTPKYIAPFWGKVTPFALISGDQFRALIAQSGPVLFGSPIFVQQAKDLVTLSANLTDEQKMIAEYWADGPHSELPPGHWDLFAQFVSARDHHELADDVKMFFAMTNAIFDGGIVAWDAKRAFNSVRPVTAIPFLFQGQQIQAWGGPGKGTVGMDGSNWIPYQPSTFPTPPFPECSSGHSTFSAAGAEILKLFTGSDSFGNSATFQAGTSRIEPGVTPAHPLTLSWQTFSDAANQAGISRRYGGIHFEIGDLTGTVTGRLVADQAWAKAVSLWSGGNSDEDE